MSGVDTLPEVGQDVSLECREAGRVVFRLRTRVYYAERNGQLWLFLPAEQIVPQLEVGTPVQAAWIQGDACYGLETNVRDITLTSDVDTGRRYFMVQLGKPRRVRQIQRREFFRFPLTLPFRFRHVLLPVGFREDDTMRVQLMRAWGRERDQLLHSADSRDISGGGLGMFANQAIEVGQGVYLELNIPIGLLQLTGRVVRCVPGSFAYRVGMEFIGLEREQQEQITRHFFQEQKRREQA